VVYRDVFPTLWRTWMENENYSHGYLVPPVVAFLFWVERRRFTRAIGTGSAWGIALIAAALLGQVVSIRAGVFMTQGYSFVLLLYGIALLFFGGRATRTVWFGIGYLVFMLPMPPFLMNVVSFNLKLLAARTGSAIAAKMGIPLVATARKSSVFNGDLQSAGFRAVDLHDSKLVVVPTSSLPPPAPTPFTVVSGGVATPAVEAKAAGLGERTAALVTQVEPGSLAAAADIQGDHGQGIIHGNCGIRHPDQTMFISQRLVEGASQRNGNVLNNVVLVGSVG
jgi:hypothetical protein